MELSVIVVLALAALLHATWNLLAKRSQDPPVFLWLALVVVCVAGALPFLAGYRPVPAAGLGAVGVSGVLEALYFMLLGGAYQRGDMALVYPLARGSAIVFVTLFAAGFLGESVPPGGLAGIGLIVAGIYTLHLRSFAWSGLAAPIRSLRDRSSQLAVLTGVMIASYSAVDKVGVRYIDPVHYIYLIFLAATICFTPYILATRASLIIPEWRRNRGPILGVAALYLLTYGLVLWALTTSKVSYVSSVREIGIVFAALLGAFVLREPFGRQKILGAGLIFAGIVAIGLVR
ncbi:MAG TPA: DMT family transporter [Chloroflexia bacterium]|nr:DMT family transporter [Chloroflexia bacterium]